MSEDVSPIDERLQTVEWKEMIEPDGFQKFREPLQPWSELLGSFFR